MTLATEIISELKTRMVRSNKAVGETLTEIAEMKATLERAEKRLKRQYRKDKKYLSSIVCKNGTNKG